MAVLYTIGHSTRTIEDLIGALKSHQVQTLADIRAFPMSRRLPQFNRDSLEQTMPAAGIRYVWLKALGGYRKKILDESPNVGLRNQSFRNYADYMLTEEFERAVEDLLTIADESSHPTLSPKEGEEDGAPRSRRLEPFRLARCGRRLEPLRH